MSKMNSWSSLTNIFYSKILPYLLINSMLSFKLKFLKLSYIYFFCIAYLICQEILYTSKTYGESYQFSAASLLSP